MSFLSSDDHYEYVKMCVDEAETPINSLKDIYQGINEDLIDILEQMLQFNPYFRPTTKELLQHHVFDQIRTKKEP